VRCKAMEKKREEKRGKRKREAASQDMSLPLLCLVRVTAVHSYESEESSSPLTSLYGMEVVEADGKAVRQLAVAKWSSPPFIAFL